MEILAFATQDPFFSLATRERTVLGSPIETLSMNDLQRSERANLGTNDWRLENRSWLDTQHLSMNIRLLGLTGIGIVLAGCATSNLPTGARLVGGGLAIEYRAPSDGTVILTERTSGRMVATESLGEGDGFSFSQNDPSCARVLFSMFAPTNAVPTDEFLPVPTNTFFQLYFVPAKAKRR